MQTSCVPNSRLCQKCIYPALKTPSVAPHMTTKSQSDICQASQSITQPNSPPGLPIRTPLLSGRGVLTQRPSLLKLYSFLSNEHFHSPVWARSRTSLANASRASPIAWWICPSSRGWGSGFWWGNRLGSASLWGEGSGELRRASSWSGTLDEISGFSNALSLWINWTNREVREFQLRWILGLQKYIARSVARMPIVATRPNIKASVFSVDTTDIEISLNS